MKRKFAAFLIALSMAALLLFAACDKPPESRTYIAFEIRYELNPDETSYCFSCFVYQTQSKPEPIKNVVIESVYSGLPVTSVDEFMFHDYEYLESIVIPKSIENIGTAAFTGCPELSSITVESGNDKYRSENNCLIETETGRLLVGCDDSIVPTDGSIREICDYAFSFRKFTSITIPNSVEFISENAFSLSNNLTDIHYGGKKAEWNKITDAAMYKNSPFLTGTRTIRCTDGNIVCTDGNVIE